MKLHIGSGSVYLDGWLNLDVQSPDTFLASQRPDLVEIYRTTDDNYYAKHQNKTKDTLREGPLNQEYVCDLYGDFSRIPKGPFDEVLARHSFEHLSLSEAKTALGQIHCQMKFGGLLRLDVPDHEESLEQLMKTQDKFYIRHLLGPRRNEYGFHMMSYTRERLRQLVEDHGFEYLDEEKNIHFYPAFCLRFMRA